MNKILFHLNCLEHGGAERVVSNLANQFAREGYEVIVVTEWEGEEEYQLDERVKRVHVGLKESDEKRSRISKAFRRFFYLRKYILQEKPDITLAFAQKAIYRALGATLFTKEKVIIAVRTDPVGHYDQLVDKIMIPILFPHAAGAVFQTEGQRDFFPKYIQEKSTIILNPLHDKYIEAKLPESRVKTVVHSGRIVDFKNQDMLIRAFAKVHEKHPEYDLKIYGGDSFDGTMQVLLKAIKECNAADYVKLMGNSDNLDKELANGALYAFSSDWEGLPNALLEAMALGLPVVATDCPCGGPRTVIQNEVNGLLVPIKNPKALEDGINRLIENPEFAEALGREAKKICEQLNGPAIIEQWRKYIEKTIEKE